VQPGTKVLKVTWVPQAIRVLPALLEQRVQAAPRVRRVKLVLPAQAVLRVIQVQVIPAQVVLRALRARVVQREQVVRREQQAPRVLAASLVHRVPRAQLAPQVQRVKPV